MLKRLLILLPIMLAGSTLASAGVAYGTFTFTYSGTISITGGTDLQDATELTFGEGSWYVNASLPVNYDLTHPNDLQPEMNVLEGISGGATGVSAVPFLAFNLSWIGVSHGPYTFTSSSISDSSSGPNELTVDIAGTFTDGSSFFDTNSANVELSFGQAKGVGAISVEGTFDTPPAPTDPAPEPATMGLLGSALIGLGIIGRRRKA